MHTRSSPGYGTAVNHSVNHSLLAWHHGYASVPFSKSIRFITYGHNVCWYTMLGHVKEAQMRITQEKKSTASSLITTRCSAPIRHDRNLERRILQKVSDWDPGGIATRVTYWTPFDRTWFTLTRAYTRRLSRRRGSVDVCRYENNNREVVCNCKIVWQKEGGPDRTYSLKSFECEIHSLESHRHRSPGEIRADKSPGSGLDQDRRCWRPSVSIGVCRKSE